MTRIARGGIIAATLMALAIGLYFGLRIRQVRPPTTVPLDPTRTVVEIQIPTVNVETDRNNAFVVPEEIVLPPRPTLRIKGTFRTGSRTGGAAVIAEAKVPIANGRMALFNNGTKGVRMRENSECQFELLMHFPDTIEPGVLEIRLGKEYLATAKFKPAP